MIRDVPTGAVFTFDRNGSGARRVGRIGRVGAVDPLSAGIGAATSFATSAVALWMNSIQLSHNADTATTVIVDGLAAQLSNLVNAYLSEAATCANQRAALNAYDQAWAWLQSPQACGNPNFGAAANRCITDRAPGGKFPWNKYYRDPIANDPRLAGQTCDTGQQVILPSVTTGAYSPAAITSSGGSSATGQTAAELAAQAALNAAAATGTAATGSAVTVADLQIPTPYLWLSIGLAAVLFLSRGKS